MGKSIFAVCVLVSVLVSPAWAMYYSTFNEPLYTMNAYLVPQDGWTSTTGTNKIWTDVVDGYSGGGTVQIQPANSGQTRLATHVLNADNPTGVVTVDIDQLPGIVESSEGDGNIWKFHVLDGNGAIAAFWYGSALGGAQVKDGAFNLIGAVPGGTTGQTTLRAVIDIPAHSTTYYYDKHDGNGMQQLCVGTGYTATSAASVQFQAEVRSDLNGNWAFFDNLNIPEPSMLAMLGLGLVFVRRRGA